MTSFLFYLSSLTAIPRCKPLSDLLIWDFCGISAVVGFLINDLTNMVHLGYSLLVITFLS